MKFLDILLEYGYDLPHKINEYRERQGKAPLTDEPAEDTEPTPETNTLSLNRFK